MWETTHWIARQLLSGSVYGGLVIALVWLVCHRVTRIPASVRAMLWWLAALKLVIALTPLPALRLPILPPERPATSLEAPVALTADGARPAAAAPKERGTAGGTIAASTPWIVAGVAVWLLVVLAQAANLVASHRRLRGVVSRSTPLDGEHWLLVERLARDLGVRSPPGLRCSTEIGTPQVVGIMRPVILLPPVTDALTPEERAMTICNELLHVRRRDLLLGWVPAIAERLFFFHPLARLAAREYLVAREAACDAAVVRTLGIEPRAYARLLVHLGIGRSEPGFAATGSSTSSSFLKRRLAMLDRPSPSGIRPVVTGLAVTALALAVLPVQVVARTSTESRADVSLGPELRADSDEQDRTAAASPIPGKVTTGRSGRMPGQPAPSTDTTATMTSPTPPVPPFIEEQLLAARARLLAYESPEVPQDTAKNESGTPETPPSTPQQILDAVQQLQRLLAQTEQMKAVDSLAARFFSEQHPDRQRSRAEMQALEQEFRRLMKQLPELEAKTLPHVDALLAQLAAASPLEPRNPQKASLEELRRGLQRLESQRAAMDAQRRMLDAQLEQLTAEERALAARIERMSEDLKKLQTEKPAKPDQPAATPRK